MKIKIVNLKLFEETHGIFGFNDLQSHNEHIVFAVCEVKSLFRKHRTFLLHILNCLIWCKENKSIKIVDDSIPEDWVFLEKFKEGGIVHTPGLSYYQNITLKNLYSPKWMIEDKEFFLDIVEEPSKAYQKFFDHEILPVKKDEWEEADRYFKKSTNDKLTQK